MRRVRVGGGGDKERDYGFTGFAVGGVQRDAGVQALEGLLVDSKLSFLRSVFES
jgi:hypothetical protein